MLFLDGVHSNFALFVFVFSGSLRQATTTGNAGEARGGTPSPGVGCGLLYRMAEGSRNNNQDQDAEGIGTQGLNPVRPHDTLGYYAKLNVCVDCTQEEIKRQYRQLVRFYHPDKIEQVRALIGEQHNTNTDANNENQQGEAEDDQEYGVTEAKQGLASSSGLDGAATRSFAKLQEAYETLSP